MMMNLENNTEWRERLLNRFLKYVSFHTTSDENSTTKPSTERQWDIANYLVQELTSLGLEEVAVDKFGYVTAYLPSNIDNTVPTIGFISHYDTSPDFSGKNIKPKIWENYNGEDLLLNKETGFTLSTKEFPELTQYKGQTLITTDGTTLLGADDKAGIAEIVTATEYMLAHPEIKHGRIAIAFTCDEEIGTGVDDFDVKKFGAEWAYTMDGSFVGELEYENFNAASAKISIKGKMVHPGYAKGKMENAVILANEYMQLLPANERPENTTGYKGFYHLHTIQGDISSAKLEYIIRDHDRDKFEARKAFVKEVAEQLNTKYEKTIFIAEVKDQYLNMKEKIADKMHIIEYAKNAMIEAGITPDIKAIRGGTDGAKLSYMGLSCPNIFAGGINFHGPYEYVPLESMMKAMEVVINISKSIK